jgi:hypothetical protein
MQRRDYDNLIHALTLLSRIVFHRNYQYEILGYQAAQLLVLFGNKRKWGSKATPSVFGPLTSALNIFERVTTLILRSFITLSLISMGSNALAEGIVTRENLLNFYKQTAFAHKDGRLIRFASQAEYTVDVVCLSTTCENAMMKLSEYLPARRFRIRAVEEYNPTSVISLIYYENVEQAASVLKLTGNILIGPNQQIFQDGVPECKSVSLIEAGSEIKTLAVFLNNTLTENKLISCALVQLVRGSGLMLNQDISEAWAKLDKEHTAQGGKFSSILKGLARLLAIHFIRGVDPGSDHQKFDEVVRNIDTHDLIAE